MNDVASLDRVRAIQSVATLDGLYDEARHLSVTPGWIKRDKPILTAEPTGSFVPAHWQYELVKPALDAASRLVDVKLAERRNLILANPAVHNRVATADTLVCAYQTILPGEAARSHRHTPHALRVIIDAKGAFSTVNGEKTPMESGDVVLTPGGSWHGHGHDGQDPAYWFDGLDVPLTSMLSAIFYEEHPQEFEPVVSVVTTSPYRFTGDSIARNLDQAKPHPEGHHGARIALAAPEMPTMGLTMERLTAGMKTRRQRSTANEVLCVTQGSGETSVGGERYRWQRGDTIVIPSWTKHEHRAETDAVLFRLSDEPLMRFARYYRFEAE
jgi:gentisate 1,2-dioxygenase